MTLPASNASLIISKGHKCYQMHQLLPEISTLDVLWIFNLLGFGSLTQMVKHVDIQSIQYDLEGSWMEGLYNFQKYNFEKKYLYACCLA